MKFFGIVCLCSFLFADEDPFNTTQHQINLDGNVLSYKAITGTLPLFDEDKKTAELFFIAYIKDDGGDRPITFVFPGGPGAAGTLESLVALGPRRLLTAAEGRSILPPYTIIDNPESIIDLTDLVFVDPVNCGFSQAEEEDHLPYFYSVEGDIQTLGEFIQTFISHFERWNSPKYLSGGSYGTLRCSGLALNLLQYDILINGILIDGCAIEWSTIQSERDRFFPDCFLVPTFAATAWRHGRLWPEKSIIEIVDYARRFAYESYAPAMLQPSRLSQFEQTEFYRQLGELIGLPPDTVRRYKGRINEKIFTSEFFAPDRKVLGGLDTRYSGDIDSIYPAGQDPSYKDSSGIGAAFQTYLKKELQTAIPFSNYVLFSWNIIYDWRTGTYDSKGEPDFLQRLRRVMIYNPEMKVFVGSGYYDCRTPFAATEYCFDHLDLPPQYKKNLQFEYYEAGHGFVLDLPSLQKMKKDLTRFYTR